MSPRQVIEQQSMGLLTVATIIVASVSVTWHLVSQLSAIRESLQGLVRVVENNTKTIDRHEARIGNLERVR